VNDQIPARPEYSRDLAKHFFGGGKMFDHHVGRYEVA
jgi:hypothetical protein